MFYVLAEVKAMPAPTSKRPEEREFVVDAGASMHIMMSKKELSSEEIWTVEKVQQPDSSVDCERESAHLRGGTSVRS